MKWITIPPYHSATIHVSVVRPSHSTDCLQNHMNVLEMSETVRVNQWPTELHQKSRNNALQQTSTLSRSMLKASATCKVRLRNRSALSNSKCCHTEMESVGVLRPVRRIGHLKATLKWKVLNKEMTQSQYTDDCQMTQSQYTDDWEIGQSQYTDDC